MRCLLARQSVACEQQWLPTVLERAEALASIEQAVQRRDIGAGDTGTFGDLAREPSHLPRRLPDAVAEALVVEAALEQALVERGEPRQRRLVEHRRRVGD